MDHEFTKLADEYLEEFEQARMDAETFGAGFLLVDKAGDIERKSFGEIIDYVINYLNVVKGLN